MNVIDPSSFDLVLLIGTRETVIGFELHPRNQDASRFCTCLAARLPEKTAYVEVKESVLIFATDASRLEFAIEAAAAVEIVSLLTLDAANNCLFAGRTVHLTHEGFRASLDEVPNIARRQSVVKMLNPA